MRAYVLCVFVVIFYAGNILTGKALNELPPLTIALLRLSIAFVVLLPLTYRSAWKARAAFTEHLKPLLILTLTGVAFFNTFVYTALQFTSSTNVSVLEAAIPALTAILSAWLLRERLRPVQWFGVTLSIFGAVWVVLDGRLLQIASMSFNIGDVVMIGAVVSWALYSIALKRYQHLFPAGGLILVMTGLSVLILLPLAAGEWIVAGVPALDHAPYWWGLLYLGIFPSVVALIFYNRAVQLLGASRASSFLNLLPVVTMIGAYFLLRESISVMQMIGAGLVMAGIFFVTGIKSGQKVK